MVMLAGTGSLAETCHPAWSSGSVRVRASKYRVCSCVGGGYSRGFQDGQHDHAPAEEAQPAAIGGQVFVVAGAGTEEVAQLVMASTEPGG